MVVFGLSLPKRGQNRYPLYVILKIGNRPRNRGNRGVHVVYYLGLLVHRKNKPDCGKRLFSGSCLREGRKLVPSKCNTSN